jgi:hypothetical protein
MVRRLLFIATATVASMVLFAGSAFAHFCYIAVRSPQGAQAAGANSDSWGTLDEFLGGELGLCEEGIAYVESQVEAATGLDADMLAINERTVMAQGHLRSGQNLHLSEDGKGVDYLSEEVFADFETWVGEAFAICGG